MRSKENLHANLSFLYPGNLEPCWQDKKYFYFSGTRIYDDVKDSKILSDLQGGLIDGLFNLVQFEQKGLLPEATNI